MEEKSLRNFAKIMREEGLTILEIKDNKTSVRIERNNEQNLFRPDVILNPEMDKGPERISDSTNGHYITSPMVGVVYLAPSENSDPYVNIGDKVKVGDTLCIVEAMKLMNEIPSEYDGTIIEVCVENAQVVEYGTKLFKVE